MRKSLCFIVFGWMSLFAPAANSAELSVDILDPACDDQAGAPYCSISAAIAAAVNDDVVTVQPGLYQENIQFGGKDIVLMSAGGPDVTEINGPGGTTVAIGPGGRIEGFTISGGIDSFGAGMDVIGMGAVIQSNIFDGNVQTSGGFGAGIGGNSASATISGNVFRNNTCDEQFLSGVVSFVNGSSPVISDNLFIDNDCRGTSMTLPADAQPQIVNNTFINNRTAIYFDRRIPIADQVYRNNLVVDNTIGIEVNFGTDANNPVFTNNLVFGNDTNYVGITDQTGTDGNLADDPLIADVVNGDYRLMPASPAIDAGFDQPPFTDDFLGNPRPADGDGDMTAAPDIGAYEAYPPTASAGADFGIGVSAPGVLDANGSSDADGTIVTYQWTQSAGMAVSVTGADQAVAGFTAPAQDGNMTFEVTVTDDLGFVGTDTVTVTVNAPPVPPPPTSGGGGSVGWLAVLELLLAAGYRHARPCPAMIASIRHAKRGGDDGRGVSRRETETVT